MPVTDVAETAVAQLEKILTQLTVIAGHEHMGLENRSKLQYEVIMLEDVIFRLKGVIPNDIQTLVFSDKH